VQNIFSIKKASHRDSIWKNQKPDRDDSQK